QSSAEASMTHFTSQFFARIRREFTSDTGSRVEKGEIVHVSSIEQSNNFKCVRLNGSILEVPSDLVESVNIPPVGNFLVSIASYTGLSSKELSFDKYALIRLDEKVDENFYQGAILLDSGKAVGNGLFPANYTVPLPEVSNYGTTNGFAELIADLKAQLPGETNLVKGEKVKILEIKEDWCMVEKHDGSKGTCPIKFLKKIDSIPSATNAPRLYDQPSYDKPPVYDQPVDEKTPPRPIYEQPAQSYEPPEKPDDDQPYCRAVYDFKGEYEGELSFTTGDLIYLKRRVNDDWLEGACQKNSLMGIFPVSFVEIMVDLPTTTTTNATVNQQTLGICSLL
uniref:SH3 domain-containing protein n=1 Tax=Acrobeloides nanus TaxID=290746 RepID=A0A914D3D7_9BILA